MNLQTTMINTLRAESAFTAPERSEGGSVLIITLWIAIGLVGIALYFAHTMTFELRASDNRAAGLATEQAIAGAARYVSYVLTTYATNGNVPDRSLFACEAVPVGNARFWLIGRDPAELSSAEPYFGLVDEGGKFNVNTVDSNTLACLPGMTVDFATAIADWRDTNGTMSLNYASLGYSPKHAPFETVDELRLVCGATIDLLVGNDPNRNGVLDPGETDQGGSGEASPGALEYLTVYTREPNAHADGSALTNVNTQSSLRALLRSVLPARTAEIMRRLYPSGQPAPSYNNLLRFYLRSEMTADEFALIYNDLTTSSTSYFRNRVNINTASAAVLNALFLGLGVDQMTASGAAQQLVDYREQNSANLASVAWVVSALGNSSPVVQALARGNYLTTRTFQFTADIAAVGPHGRGYRRVKFVFDTSDGECKILYRQDLSRLGWALGDTARETWIAKAQ
jgi:DNA uptake protein ComE-like DNA-binding protein